jgi:hypothetical protein
MEATENDNDNWLWAQQRRNAHRRLLRWSRQLNVGPFKACQLNPHL